MAMLFGVLTIHNRQRFMMHAMNWELMVGKRPRPGVPRDEHWKDLVVENVGDMARRDRNRPSIIIWGV
jgi:beta-galactosidase/beta-glucuronidase